MLRPAVLLPPKRLLTPRLDESAAAGGLLPGAPKLTRTVLTPVGIVEYATFNFANTGLLDYRFRTHQLFTISRRIAGMSIVLQCDPLDFTRSYFYFLSVGQDRFILKLYLNYFFIIIETSILL